MMSTVLEYRHFGIKSGREVQSYRSLNAHSAWAANQLYLEQYVGVSDLCGMPVSILSILWTEIDQLFYLHVNTCNHSCKNDCENVTSWSI